MLRKLTILLLNLVAAWGLLGNALAVEGEAVQVIELSGQADSNFYIILTGSFIAIMAAIGVVLRLFKPKYYVRSEEKQKQKPLLEKKPAFQVQGPAFEIKKTQKVKKNVEGKIRRQKMRFPSSTSPSSNDKPDLEEELSEQEKRLNKAREKRAIKVASHKSQHREKIKNELEDIQQFLLQYEDGQSSEPIKNRMSEVEQVIEGQKKRPPKDRESLLTRLENHRAELMACERDMKEKKQVQGNLEFKITPPEQHNLTSNQSINKSEFSEKASPELDRKLLLEVEGRRKKLDGLIAQLKDV